MPTVQEDHQAGVTDCPKEARHFSPYPPPDVPAGQAAQPGSALAVGVGIAVLSGHGGAATPGGAPSKAAVRAIAYARQQLGKPYLWGGTGPGAYDCSGLVMEAYAHAGVGIARTSQAQWATERHVSSPGRETWCSTPALTAPGRHPGTSPWSSATAR